MQVAEQATACFLKEFYLPGCRFTQGGIQPTVSEISNETTKPRHIKFNLLTRALKFYKII